MSNPESLSRLVSFMDVGPFVLIQRGRAITSKQKEVRSILLSHPHFVEGGATRRREIGRTAEEGINCVVLSFHLTPLVSSFLHRTYLVSSDPIGISMFLFY